MPDGMNDLVKLRGLLARAWEQRRMLSIIPGEMDVLRIVLWDEDRAIIEHPRMALPDGPSVIAALVEGLEKAFEEMDSE